MTLIDWERQEAFALLSGDRNPMHVDPLQARRSRFGAPVVHGAHLVLLALEALDEPGPWAIRSLDVQFRGAVLVGEAIECQVLRADSGARRVSVLVEGQPRAIVTAELTGEACADVPGPFPGAEAEGSLCSYDLADLVGMAGQEKVWLDQSLLASLFPRLAGPASPADVAVLLAVSRAIGMRCPGRWALFRRLSWKQAISTLAPDALSYAIRRLDPRLDLAVMELEAGGRAMTAEVIVRHPPPEQPSLRRVSASVSRGEFRGVRALVVGGSRGLGELASKLIVAGGGHVLLSYRTGSDEAQAVARESLGSATVFKLDVEDLTGENPQVIRDFSPTHLLYFATPPIARRPPATWDTKTFERFISVYVLGFSRMLQLVDRLGGLQGILYPSTVYVEKPAPGFLEYAAAKAAGEQVCFIWQGLRPHQRVVVERFRPLVTDQTAALLGADTSGNTAVVLAALRRCTSEVDAGMSLIPTT
jgi:acyl dehydratase